MRARHSFLLVLALALTSAGCRVSESASTRAATESWLAEIRAVASPVGTASGQPHLQSGSRGVLLSWVERIGNTAHLKYAEYDAQWTTARTVASGDNWFVNWADVPSVVRLDDRTLAAHWLQKSGEGTYAYDVRLSHSTDNGRTWSASSLPHHDGTQSEHGFASLFALPTGGLGLAWLDGRQTKSAGGHDSHDGAMTIRYGAFDTTWRQVVDQPIDTRVCDCCPTTAAMTSDGPIVAYRNRTDDEVRDIVTSRLEDGRWSEPVAVHDDGWQIAACPVNGPMLSARGRDVVLAWFTAVGDVGHAYVAFSGDAGRTFGNPIRVDDRTTQGRVDVELLADGSAAVTWIELTDPGAAFMVRRIGADGARSPAAHVATLDGQRTSGYPRMALAGTSLVFAWTDAHAKTVRVAAGTLNTD